MPEEEEAPSWRPLAAEEEEEEEVAVGASPAGPLLPSVVAVESAAEGAGPANRRFL